jgi:hypothetical protein
MGFQVKRFENEPIILVTWTDPMDVGKDIPDSFPAIDALVEEDEAVFCINDLRGIKTNFSETVIAMAYSRKKAPGSPRDPRLHNILVSPNELMQLVARSAGQDQYGNLNVAIYGTVEEALEHARRAPREELS